MNKDRPVLSGQKCRPMTLVSGDISIMRIFAEVPLEGGVKRQWDCQQRQFSAFFAGYFFVTLEMRPVLLHIL